MDKNKQQDLARKNALMGLMVLAVVIGMVGLSFAAVPLYNLFCRVTGFGGTTQVAATLPEAVLEREVRILFNADTGRSLRWEFTPDQREITVKLGERGFTAYTARNTAAKPTTGTAVYNVTPPKAGKYFHKIQCFCFDEQTLRPGQEVSMPVLFYVDPEMDEDRDMDDVKAITLSYTFFKAESKALEDAMEDFYNDGSPEGQNTN